MVRACVRACVRVCVHACVRECVCACCCCVLFYGMKCVCMYFARDLQPLMEVMGLILDTPSKRVLWRYVLPRITAAHQGVVRQMMDLPPSSHSGTVSAQAVRGPRLLTTPLLPPSQ